MAGRVEQAEAFRKAQRGVWVPVFIPLLFVLAFSAGRGDLRVEPDNVLALLLIVLGLAAFVAWTRFQARQIPARYAFREARVPARADALMPGLRTHMRRWWLVHVEDVRGWRSLYGQDLDPAPLRLPFELDEEGGEAVLRGSAIHVEAAERWALRRMAQGQA